MAEVKPPPIWTLDARDNVYLAVAARYYGVSGSAMRRLIVQAHHDLIQKLASKGVYYRDLQKPLVPSRERREIALIFRSDKCAHAWNYVVHAAHLIIPNLARQGRSSFLAGDLLGIERAALDLLLRNSIVEGEHGLASHADLFCVYVNNLSDSMVEAIHGGLCSSEEYCGYVDSTYSSRLKEIFSALLVPLYVKSGNVVLCAHEDGVPEGEDDNTPCWPWSEFGFTVRSVELVYFMLFLGYKIERSSRYDTSGDDFLYSLSSISETPIPLGQLSIGVDRSKFEYLSLHKSGIMQLLRLTGISAKEFKEILWSKITGSYVYQLDYLADYEVSKFNIMLEFQDIETGKIRKAMAAFKYDGDANRLDLVTFY